MDTFECGSVTVTALERSSKTVSRFHRPCLDSPADSKQPELQLQNQAAYLRRALPSVAFEIFWPVPIHWPGHRT